MLGHVLHRDLHLLPPEPSGVLAGRARPCRTCGCEALAEDPLGFCAVCRIRYDDRSRRRRRFMRAVCARLAAAGDPLFTAFGGRGGALGAHVSAHLEAYRTGHVHVPPAAVRDYVDELDEFARRSG